jgi:hypothetical protein
LNGKSNSTTGYFVTGCLSEAHDDSFAAVRVTLDDGTEGLFPLASEPSCGARVSFSVNDGTERKLCFDAAAVDVAGNETSFGDQVCVELQHADGAGCAQAGAPGALAGLAALLFARRRRVVRSST